MLFCFKHMHVHLYVFVSHNIAHTHICMYIYIWAYTCAFAYITLLSSQGPGWQRCARRQRPGRAACCAPGGVGEEGGLRRGATIAAGVVDDDSFADHDNVMVYVPNPIKSYGGYVPNPMVV